ncbi:MAG: hypothetical protein ABIA37_03200, partial [Candidatus Woesearchaeota archaeon]
MSQKKDYDLSELLKLESKRPAYPNRLKIDSPREYGELLLNLREEAYKILARKIPAWDSSTQSDFDTVLRELGVNAAKYGNRYQSGSEVDFKIYTKEN